MCNAYVAVNEMQPLIKIIAIDKSTQATVSDVRHAPRYVINEDVDSQPENFQIKNNLYSTQFHVCHMLGSNVARILILI